MIHLDYPEVVCPGRLAVCKRVEPSSEDRVLAHAATNCLRKSVLCVPAPHYNVTTYCQ